MITVDFPRMAREIDRDHGCRGVRWGGAAVRPGAVARRLGPGAGVVGEFADPLGEFAGDDVVEGDLIEDGPFVGAQRDPDALQRLRRADVAEVLRALTPGDDLTQNISKLNFCLLSCFNRLKATYMVKLAL